MSAWILGTAAVVLLLLAGASLLLRGLLKKAASRVGPQLPLDELERGLAIPMRDSDTRRSSRKDS